VGHADPRTTRRYDRARHNLTAVASLLAAVAFFDYRTLTGQTTLGTPGQPTPAYDRISAVVGQAPDVRLIPALLGLAGIALLSRSAAISNRAYRTAAALAALLNLLFTKRPPARGWARVGQWPFAPGGKPSSTRSVTNLASSYPTAASVDYARGSSIRLAS